MSDLREKIQAAVEEHWHRRESLSDVLVGVVRDHLEATRKERANKGVGFVHRWHQSYSASHFDVMNALAASDALLVPGTGAEG